MKSKYTEIMNVIEWENYWSDSILQSLLVLKHSTACPISSAALSEFAIYSQKPKRLITCVMLKVIESRDLSNHIAHITNIAHQSPQIILVNKKEVLWYDSHWEITYERIEQEVNSRI